MVRNKDFFWNDPYHTFVIAEAGSNWKAGSYKEDLQRAKRLIEIASEAGADAIKFQTYRPETVYVPNAGQIKYLSKVQKDDNINEMFKKLSMPYEMLSELAKYCKKNKIMFMSTPFSVQDAKQIDPYVKVHKVASYEINHIRLLEFLSQTKKPVLISTGASTFNEIDFAVNLMKRNKSGPIVLLQCTSKYPAPIDALNILVIPKLKEKYQVPVGFSDHSFDPLIGPLMAVGMGATIIEKHFTLDRNFSGPDHAFALIPEELKKMISYVRLADKAKGSGDKEILKEEQELHRFATRSVQAIRNISKGEILEEGVNIDILRPGRQKRGAEPRFLYKIMGKKSVRNLKIGEGIMLNDCI